MDNIKAFISYKRSDDNVLYAIKSALEKIGIEPIWDKNNVPFGTDFRSELSHWIQESDCVLVSVTSLDSPEVIYELIVAHDRGKKILLIAEESNINIEIPKSLFFLHTNNRITYRSYNSLDFDIQQYFKDKKKEDFLSMPIELNRIIETTRKIINLPNFTSHLVRKILAEALTEIQSIEQVEYRINVGIEKNFLIRAQSLFENAENVYAFSIDHVSTFWTHDKNRGLAKQYIQHQPQNTMRIFVFSTPSEANKYKNILHASHDRYGENGGVFICSLKSYKALLERFTLDVDTNYSKQDFAILVYEYRGKKYHVEAQFDESELRFKTLSLEADYKLLIDFFNEINVLNYTDVYKGDEGNIKIKRWNPDSLHRDNDVWKTDLAELFPEEIGGVAYHTVYFKELSQEKEEILLKMKTRLLNNKELLGIQYLWFGKQTRVDHAFDGLSKGTLKINYEKGYILIIKLADYPALLRYYSNTFHAKVRKDLYTKMNDGLKVLYGFWDRMKMHLQEDEEKELFEKVVEELVSNNMIRQDYVELIDIDSIISEQPYKFPI